MLFINNVISKPVRCNQHRQGEEYSKDDRRFFHQSYKYRSVLQNSSMILG